MVIWYDSLKSIFITVKMIIISCGHDVFSCTYKTYKSILAVTTDDTHMANQNRVWFERLTKDSDTLFYYTFQEGSKLKLLNIAIIQSEHGIIID